MASETRQGGRAGTDEQVDAGDVIDLTELDRAGLHIDDGGEFEDLGDDHREVEDESLAELVDAFAEAYNAHDLDGVRDVLADEAELPGLGGDLGGLSAAVERLWDERPTAVLTRGLLEDRPVAVLWDASDDRGWCRVAMLTFDGDDGSEVLGLVELIEESAIVDEADAEAPEDELLEGARWDEWDEGAPT